MIGNSLTHYRITAKLGAGGMGEVYRATDTRLGREVAIKVLPASYSRDPQSLARFEREAKALAALNHPHIAGIHGFDADQGTHFLVLELVEGETLGERLRRGPLPLKEALTVARQIAEAIQEAHEKGIIHRDLKPGNVKLTPHGRVKVLDFGLAKMEQTLRGGPHPTIDPNAPTVPADTTLPGAVMGTPAYMSPEQARGQEVDKRTDIWAFGCCLFECLSGRQPFRGRTASDLMAEVLKNEPDWSQIPAETPREVTTLLRRCLEKEPARRLSSIGDIAITLEESTRGPAASVPSQTPQPPATSPSVPAPGGLSPRRLWPAATAVLILVVGAGIYFWKRSGTDHNSQVVSDGVMPNAAALSNSNVALVVTPATDRKSIAVLPFVNMSADKADEYISDGMTEELLNVLAKVPGLRVPGRSSSFAFKGKNEDDIFRKVGGQLHVATVLEGSVRKAGNKLRITAQLINVADGFHLWSETYDRDMTDIFAIQSDVAQRVVKVLKIQLLAGAQQQIEKRGTQNLEAYQSYLKGRYQWNRRTGESLKQAIEFFDQAIAKDPGYAVAYAGLADCYLTLPEYAGLPPRETFPKARAAALKALELDGGLAEARTALAAVKARWDWDWAGAEAEFRRAIALNANYATAHQWLMAAVLRPSRRFVESLEEIKRAQELDPLSPVINVDLGECHSLLGNHELGIQVVQRLIATDPSFLVAHRILGRNYLRAAKYPEAVTALEGMQRLEGNGAFGLEDLGIAYARAGRTDEARQTLSRLLDQQQQGNDRRVGIALVQDALGEREPALDSLDLAFAEHARSLEFIRYMPLTEDLLPHPRVQAILKRMNLVQ